MKTCSYCGKQYEDDVIVCSIDGQLLDPKKPRKTISGTWRGTYGYDNEKYIALVVQFTFRIKHGWFGHFTGSVTEDSPGTPGTGAIDGYFGWPTIEFTKQMPVSYTTTPEGKHITMREWIIAQGAECKNELPGPLITYTGDFLDANRVQGSWIIRRRTFSSSDGRKWSIRKTTGTWCAEFVTTDLKAMPKGGPQQPFFQKELLPFRPEADPDFHLLGKFSVIDADTILKRFEKGKVRFGISRDPNASRQIRGRYARMIEIYVHTDDKEKAAAIAYVDLRV